MNSLPSRAFCTSFTLAWFGYVGLAWLAMLAIAFGDELLVLPAELHVSADYPAQITVIQKLADGTLIDRTRHAETIYQIERGDHLQVNSMGLLDVIDQASSASSSRLVVTHDQLSTSCSIKTSNHRPQQPTFAREISAVLGKAGCNLGTCHGNLHGKAGLRLSLRGDDPELDYFAITQSDRGRRVDAFAAESSLLIRKPLGALAHQGGVRFKLDSKAYAWLKKWIETGCTWNQNDQNSIGNHSMAIQSDATLSDLTVLPNKALLSHQDRSIQLVVNARFADGSTLDVTPWARYEASVVSGISISENGLVTTEGPLDVSISVSYLSGRTATRLTFLPQQMPPSTDTTPESSTDSILDQLVEQQIQAMRVKPTPLIDDSVFLRRAYLSVVGRLPTPDEVRLYLASTDDDKRERLIDRLLEDPGYSTLWALRWSDLLRNEQKVMSSKGAKQWFDWLEKQIADDRPLTETAYAMVTGIGSTYDNPPASFHRAHRDPTIAAESIGQVFLGIRLQCARCHNHPFDSWRQDDYYGLAAYFTTIQRKQIDNQPKDKFDKHIISGDELISLADRRPRIWHPGRAQDIHPKPLNGQRVSEFDEDDEPIASGSEDAVIPLVQLADWLTNENRMFSRNMANRVWYHYMGRGIVDPPDDFRDSNPASNPELLEYLTDQLIANHYSVRELARQILRSRAFLRQSTVTTPSDEVLNGESMFASYPLRRIPAEPLFDAICDVTGTIDEKWNDPLANFSARAIAQAETSTKAGFMTAFGKPNRLLVCECERSNDVSLGQSLILVNGLEVREKLATADNRIGKLLAGGFDASMAIEELFLCSLTRFPTEQERRDFVSYVDQASDVRRAMEDVLWALLNSKEFILIR